MTRPEWLRSPRSVGPRGWATCYSASNSWSSGCRTRTCPATTSRGWCRCWTRIPLRRPRWSGCQNWKWARENPLYRVLSWFLLSCGTQNSRESSKVHNETYALTLTCDRYFSISQRPFVSQFASCIHRKPPASLQWWSFRSEPWGGLSDLAPIKLPLINNKMRTA